MSKFLFRLRYEVKGIHTHVRFFAGKGSSSLGKCGDLVFRNEEWEEFLRELDRRPPGGCIEVLPEAAPEVLLPFKVIRR